MKTIFTFFLIFSNLAFAGGDLVNNGGGIAEKNILYSYQKLGSYIKLCLDTQSCKIDKEQRQILEQILAGLTSEQQNSEQIKFVSEKSTPGFFILDGEMKVAKTGSQIGSPIYINTDLIYTQNELGFSIPVSISEATAILIHELGHHYGSHSHTTLDLVAVRVALMLQQKTYNTPLLPWSQQISAIIINPDVDSAYPEILLYIEDQVLDLSKKFFETVFCPKFSIPLPFVPDIPISTQKPISTLAHNVHWSKLSVQGDTATLAISADLAHKCKDTDDKTNRSHDFLFKIEFSVTRENSKWRLNEDSVQVKQDKRSSLTGR